ncbi:hypothetical protein EUX98_g3859 [Antrodiella citrinella]|uniref:Uncharacterized protein n=1 Tax=Antrodiella citrinella TaxID=2447956 RepID=A0A4S4MVI4_9APHY|nr:hypothetical protein EUX98_g3859 [Antrodiella citrinella]
MSASPTKAPQGKGLYYNPTPSPAKATRHCTICKRSMLGHPRGRCPDSEPAPPAVSPTKAKVPVRGAPQPPQRIPVEDEQAERRRRRSSIPTPLANVAHLPSLTPAGKDAVQRLMQPGIMDDAMIVDDDRNRANVLRWLDNVEGPEEASGPMTNFRASDPFASPTSPTKLKAEASLPQIVKDKAAHAIVVDLDTIRETMKQMENKGFQIRALYPPKNSVQRNAWLIVGRDQDMVDALVNRMLVGGRT